MGLYGNRFLVEDFNKNQKISLEDYINSLDKNQRDKIYKKCNDKLSNLIKEANKILKELKITNIAHVENINLDDIIESYEDLRYSYDSIYFISFDNIEEQKFLDYINEIIKKIKQKIDYKGLRVTEYDDFCLLLCLSKEFFYI